MAEAPAYAELCTLSHFSFQQGASSPQELVARAHELGYTALALTDDCSMAGVVRAHQAAQACGLKLLIGTRLTVQAPGLCGASFTLVLLAQHRRGYGQLCELITAARSREVRGAGRYALTWASGPLAELDLSDTLAIVLPQRQTGAPGDSVTPDLTALVQWVAGRFPQRAWLGLHLTRSLDDGLWLHQLRAAATPAVPLVALGQVLMHHPSSKPLQDVMTAIRLGRPVADCGFELEANAQAHLHRRDRLAQRYPADTLAQTLEVANRCHFTLNELRYEYPSEIVPAGHTLSSYLRHATFTGARQRYPAQIPAHVQRQLEHELALIAELGYEAYFLTVYDIVGFARSRNILCQGRGSAANSAVCYCLGITEVDPASLALLFERFISKERAEPPDIDVDFEHQRREEVVQYLYRKFGRDRAALTAAVHCYHPRSAIRDVGKALGLDAETIDRLARHQRHWHGPEHLAAQWREAGLDPEDPRLRWVLTLTEQLIGAPRHLSQHSGGFVLTRERLSSTVPVVPASMPGRTTIEWDKDDLDAMGLMKVDVLALGMLTALQSALQLVSQRRGQPFRLQDIPREDPATYDMVCRADTVGVFQIESRAQMSMLPRLQPRCYYDLVVEVAIVRPGPIHGGMVHPYLQQRERLRAGGTISYPNEALKPALERTLGVPIFQEQVMQIAVIAAGFSPGEADQLRRAMAAWRRKGGVDRFRDRLIDGMRARGYERDFAEAIFRQVEGFGEYGFPESHAASFALLVYASAWLKCHEPAAFLVALLNAQPMGFYSPSQLVQDARRHGVTVRPVDVLHSLWDSHLEAPAADGSQAVRLGLRLVKGLGRAAAERLVQARSNTAWHGVQTLAAQAGLDAGDLNALAAADALQSLSGHRRQQAWDASALQRPPPLLREAPIHEAPLYLPPAPEGEAVQHDYQALGLTLRSHPLALLRPRLRRQRIAPSHEIAQQPDGRLVRACGLVTTRQQPPTAHGVVFVTLEDEDGSLQVIVWPQLKERQRTPLLNARLLAVYGRWQRRDGVGHLLAQHLVDLTPLLGELPTSSRDFH